MASYTRHGTRRPPPGVKAGASELVWDRNRGRVPPGLTSGVNADIIKGHATLSHNTVATWGKDRNPKQLCIVAEECVSLNTRATGAVRRTPSGRGGATDPHGHTACSGVNSRRPRGSRGELHSPAAIRPCFGPAAKTAKPRACPRGTSPDGSIRLAGFSTLRTLTLPFTKSTSSRGIRESTTTHSIQIRSNTIEYRGYDTYASAV